MKLRKKYLVLAMAATFVAPAIQAADVPTQLEFSTPDKLSEMSGVVGEDLGMAFKTKLARLGNGTLIALFGDGVAKTNMVYDVKKRVERPARDVFVRTCASSADDCSVADNWTTPVNLSNTALLSSKMTDWQGIADEPSAYFGDSDKANISNGGTNLMVTWTDKFCGDSKMEASSVQGSITYAELEGREIPYSCTWATYSSDSGATWSAKQRLSDGSRDAKQDSSKVNVMGKAVITWQEDPEGLQLGEGDGPGDGASGAKASPSTDIWYATATSVATAWDGELAIAGKPTGLNLIGPLTDNTSSVPPAVATVAGEESSSTHESVLAAATRPNVAIVGKNIVVAYEETKASADAAYGKFVRYHSFPYTANLTLQPGCIISNPAENSRRVRFVSQSSNLVNTAEGEDTGLRLGIIWKQGNYSKGGPSDIVGRVGFKDLANVDSYGVDPIEMQPAVDVANCETSDYSTAEALANAPALNLSTNTPNATPEDLLKNTEADHKENALAHRGAIIGNDIYIGYSYTADWDAAVNKHTATYDFWLRRFETVMTDGKPTGVWSEPQNLSNLPTVQLTVREPRIVKMPYAKKGYAPEVLVVAWGLQTNVADPQDVDIFYTRTFDKAANFEPIVRVANDAGNPRFESQLRPTPDGQTVYAVWNEVSEAATDAMISKAVSGDVTGANPYDGLYDPALEPVDPVDPVVPVVPAAPTSGGSAALFSGLLLPALMVVGLGLIGFAGFRKMKK